MKLYFAPGTCSLSPHVVLQELGLPYDLVRVDNRTKRTSEGTDFRAVNPKGYVAALMLDDGAVLTEGPAIIQYLADLRPESGLAPAPGTLARVRLQEWLNFITAELHAGSSPLFDTNLPPTARETITRRLGRRLDYVAERLDRHGFLMKGQFTVADAYLFSVLDWLPTLSIDLDAWPSIVAFQRLIAARPAVVAALSREAEFNPVVQQGTTATEGRPE